MAKPTNGPPQRPANLEGSRGSVEPPPGVGGGRRLPLAVVADLVAEWKREALVSAGAGHHRRPKVRLRLQLGFMLLVMIAGAPFGVVGWAVALITFLSVFFIQELPSVLAARAGRRGVCVVLSAGGSHVAMDGPPFARLKVAALAACGVLGNLGVAVALSQLLRRSVVAGSAAPILGAAALVHGFWGLGQVLPLPPFRFGLTITRRLRPPLRFACAAVSFVGMGVAALWVLRSPGLPAYFMLFVLTLLASTSALRDAFNDLMDEQAGVALMTTQAANLLAQEQPAAAVELAKRALARATVESNRLPLWRTLAWAAIANRDPFTAHGALLRLPPDSRDLHLVAAYLACCGRVDEAVDLLQEARHCGHRARETSKLLIDLLFQGGQLAEAGLVARADRLLLGPDNVSAIDDALAQAGAEGPRSLEGTRRSERA